MIAIAVLGVLGLCGLATGLALVTDPTGARLRLTVDRLPAWPLLTDYTVPGIVMLALFGLLPLAAAGLLAKRHRFGWAATTTVGLLLVIWMAGSFALVGLAAPLVQAAFLIVGILLTGLGLDGGASAGTSDESRVAGGSYVHADDEA
jgi:hypothetical protein